MKKLIPSTVAAVLAATTLAFLPTAADAAPRGCAPRPGGASFSGQFRSGNIGIIWNGGGRGRSEPSRPSYTERCKVVDSYYFNRGCDRYIKKTYLHERIDCHGHVVKCWKSYKTVYVGSHDDYESYADRGHDGHDH